NSLTNGYNLSSSYTVGYGRINSSATLTWNRSRTKAFNLFTNNPNGIGNPAISGIPDTSNPSDSIPAPNIYVGTSKVNTNPFYYGIPSIGISTNAGGVSGLGDSTPSDRINQTISFTDYVSWIHKKHNFRAGMDFHRIHADSIGGTNVLGSFSFSGVVTQDPNLATCKLNTEPSNPNCVAIGSSFAD